MENNLIVIEANKLELEPETKKNLLDNFKSHFENAEKLKTEAMAIQVENENQVDEMKKARELRLEIKSIRVKVEKTRVELKEDSKRKGKAIDGMANIIKYLIEPIEDHLKQQEDFVKIKKEKEMIELENKRQNELSKYVDDVGFFDLKLMNENTYQHILKSSIEKHNQIKEAEKKAEQDRIKKEKEEAEERIKIKAENERLKQEADEREKTEKIEREKREAQEKKEAAEKEIRDKKMAEEKAAIEKKEAEEKAKIEREHKAQLEKEKQAREKVENELREKREAEEKEKREVAEKKLKEIEAERQKELAPDKDKLNELALRIINIKMPDVKDQKAKDIIKKITEYLNKTNNYIKEATLNL